MDGESFMTLWRTNRALHEAVIAHANALTKDCETRADLIQEAWIAISQEPADASEEKMEEGARRAQNHAYREIVPRQPKKRGNDVISVRLDEEHRLWLNKVKAKLKWPMSAVVRLVVEKGTQILLDELSS
jgi:hypothetical protein